LSGDGARRQGGRWNPPDSYPVVYAALDVPAVDREYARAMRQAGLPLSTRKRSLATIRVHLSRVLDLTDADTRRALGIDVGDIVGDDPAVPRAIGVAASHLGFEAILAPSAAGAGSVMAILLNNRAEGSLLSVEEEDHEHLPVDTP